MKLHEHQQKIEDSLFEKSMQYNSICVQSATGSGKTVIMCSAIARYIKENPDKIVLVSVHREELIVQTSMTLAAFGIMNQTITAKSKKIQWGFSNVYVGMTQTIYARKTDLNVGLMVVDEAHEQVHLKTFSFFPNALRWGFTATPVINITRTYFKCNYCQEVYDFQDTCCYNDQTQKWKSSVTMSEQYEEIILGPPIRWLIDNGFLVDEIVFDLNFYANLKDIEDEEEIAIESVKHDDQVLKEYIEKAEEKKTMIFTASTKQNTSLVKTFETAGYNIKSYDSVNNKSSERVDIVKWFKETNGAILVSTGTFTTGFDVKEVECIIVNRPTKSLSLWHQIIGRGARVSDIIFKENFIVIDLGGNSLRLGKWSDDVDWKHIFFNGLVKPKKKKEALIQCDKCEYNWIGVQGDSCPDCNHSNVNQNPMSYRERKEQELATLNGTTKNEAKIPLPNPVKIADFVIRTTNERKDYFSIIITRYIDLWKLNRVSRKIYLERIENGSLIIKIKAYIDRMYTHAYKIKNGQPRTHNYIIKSIKDKLAEIYKM
jgi:superfamily II DNA or RNA helicase